MFSKLALIRRLADQTGRFTRLLTFDIEVELDEAEVLEELEARGYAFRARA